MEVFKGTAHGRIIELESELGFPEGQPLTVMVQPLVAMADVTDETSDNDIRLAFGTWADDAAELDKFLEWNRQQRKIGRREIEE